MLKEILAITGKPGLFRIKAHTGKSLIVEELVSGKKFPVSMRDKVVSLGDIAMYTESDDKPLSEILEVIYTTEEGKTLDVKEIIDNGTLKSQFEKYVPDFDKDRVKDSDIKKLFTWYNLLVDAGFTNFVDEVTKDEGGEEGETAKEDNAESNVEN